jgi:hypothetical protein
VENTRSPRPGSNYTTTISVLFSVDTVDSLLESYERGFDHSLMDDQLTDRIRIGFNGSSSSTIH